MINIYVRQSRNMRGIKKMGKSLIKTNVACTIQTAKKPSKVKKIKQTFLFGMVMLMGTTFVVPMNHAYAQTANISSSNLVFMFDKEPSVPKITHIKGTKKLVIDFDDASNFIQEPIIKGNPLIETLSSKRNGKKLKITIDTTRPVEYGLVYQKNGYALVLKSAKSYKEVNTSTTFEPVGSLRMTTSVDGVIQTREILRPSENFQMVGEALPGWPEGARQLTPYTPLLANQAMTPTQVITPQVPTELDSINIKAEGKTARLTLELNNTAVTPNIERTGNLLVIDLPTVSIPQEFQKNVSTSSLGTVVQNMDVATRNNNGRIVLSQTQSSDWSYSTYQMDKKVVVEVRLDNDPSERAKYVGKKLTLNFQDMDVRAILQVIADFTGLNIMTSDAVTGSMTVRLKDVPWDQALDLVLEAKNLQKQQDGNVVWIATRQEVAEKNKAQLELNTQEAELAPLKLEFFQLNHYKAQEMKAILEGNGSQGGQGGNNFAFLSRRGSVGIDGRNNTIFVQDSEIKLEEIRKIIKRLDIASKQILIEAKLVVVDDKFERDLGTKFGFGYGKRNGNTQIGVSNNSADATGIAGGTAPTGTSWNRPVEGGGSIGFTILNAVTGNMLNIELSALEENNRGKVISNPRLLTADNKKAEIRQGTEIPYVTPSTSDNPPTVQFKDAVLSLAVTPQVSANGRITMDLDIKKDTVGQLVNVQGGGQVPSIDTRSITTQVTVADGQTVVLGGIYEVSSREDLSKVPLLGDIPWVGNLFKYSSRSNNKVELLIFLTPHIIVDEDLDAINRNEQSTSKELTFKRNK